MPTDLPKKVSIQTLVTDRRRSGEARAVLPLKATALTQTASKRKGGLHSTVNEGDRAHQGSSRGASHDKRMNQKVKSKYSDG